jgi:ubiquinone/menaquinone biosynthesis C-methylase UbiE
MADESMVRTLAAQADAIWPQERALFERYDLPTSAHVIDAGCGTGEITYRLAQMLPQSRFLGVDIIDSHLDAARAACAPFGERVRFENLSIFDLGLPAEQFDLAVCRHVLQAIPHADRAIAELARVTKRGGWLHLIAEDYLMINFEPRRLDPDDFWHAGPRRFGLVNLGVDYVVVDPLRVPRGTIAAIWKAWRDGYADAVSTHTPVSREMFLAHFEDMIATIEDPNGYGVWHVPVISAQIP